MRIIKQGVIPPEQCYSTTCNNCKTEFEFYESEGRWVCGSNVDSTLSVGCPFCGKSVGLKIKHDEDFKEMSERIKLKRELNGKATKHEIDL